MFESKIAIISKNKNFSRFFELEAISCGFTASVFEKYTFEFSDYSLVVIDADTVKQIYALDIDKVLLVSEAPQCSSLYTTYDGAMFASWPISTKEVRSVFENTKMRDIAKMNDIKQNITSEDKEGVIYFFKNVKNTVRYNRRNIVLSDCELCLLKMLCTSYPEPVSHEALDMLFGKGKGNIAEVYICKLRKKLEFDGNRLIYTVRSRGYKITADMEWK